MRVEIIRPDGDLKREVWDFTLIADWGSRSGIYFDAYSFQTRGTIRRNWQKERHWTRLNRRENNIETPPLPNNVESEMRQIFADKLKALPIVC